MASSSRHKAEITIGAKDKTGGVLGKIKNNLVGIGAAYLGWRAVTGILGDIIEAGKQHEKAWNDVASALKRHGHVVDENIDKIKSFSDSMQTMTGESDEATCKMVQSFVDYGQTVDEAMETTRVAMDLAAGGGMDLKAATDLLAKAAVGYTGTLSRYGIIIDENIPKSEKFAAAIAQINQRFGGAAAARADTYAVRVKLIGQKLGDFYEMLFKLLLPVLNDIIDVGIKAIEVFQDMATGISNLLDWVGITGTLESEAKKASEQFDAWSIEIDTLTGLLNEGKLSLEEYTEAINILGKEKKIIPVPTKEDIDRFNIIPEILYNMHTDATFVILDFQMMNDETERLAKQRAFILKKQEAILLGEAVGRFRDNLRDATDDVILLTDSVIDLTAARKNLGPIISPIDYKKENEQYAAALQVRYDLADEAGQLRIRQEEEMNNLLDTLLADHYGIQELTTKEYLDAIARMKQKHADEIKNLYIDANADAMEQMNMALGQFTGQFMASFYDLVTGVEDVWDQIAKSFFNLVLQTILAGIAPGSSFMRGFLGAFKIWDIKANDEALIREGRRAISFIQQGMMEGMRTLVPRIAEAPMRIAGGDGQATIPATVINNYHFHGITDKQMLRRKWIPEIERAINDGYGRQYNITGGPDAKFL